MRRLATVFLTLLLLCSVAIASNFREDENLKITKIKAVDQGVFSKELYEIEFHRTLVDLDMVLMYGHYNEVLDTFKPVGGVSLTTFPITVHCGQKIQEEVFIPKFVSKNETLTWRLLYRKKPDTHL